MTAPSAQRLVRGLNRRKGDPRTARAQQHRRDGQVESVEEAGLEEPRHRDPSPLHQHPPKPAGTERFQHGPRLEALGAGGGKCEDFRPIPRRADRARRSRGAAHHERPGRSVREHPTVLTEATVRIEHHADRILSLHLPHREPRIVQRHGAGPHDHGVDQSPKSMEAADVSGPVM